MTTRLDRLREKLNEPLGSMGSNLNTGSWATGYCDGARDLRMKLKPVLDALVECVKIFAELEDTELGEPFTSGDQKIVNGALAALDKALEGT